MRDIQPEIREILGGKSKRTDISEIFGNLGTPFEFVLFSNNSGRCCSIPTANFPKCKPKFLVEWKLPYQFSNASDHFNQSRLKTVFVAVIVFIIILKCL